MMSSISRSDEGYESSAWFEAATHIGVRFSIARMSFGRRIDLARRIREIGRKIEYLDAGSDVRDKLEAAVLAVEIDRAYLEWGLTGIDGLNIDGEAATAATLIEKGPADLATEILAKIKAETGLSEDERKN